MHNCTYIHAWFYSLEVFLCTYPCVAWQRELMCGGFCPWGKCGWGQSDLGSEEACVWTVVYPPRSHLSHTWSDHKEIRKCSGAARLCEHTVDTHTDRIRHVLLTYRICMARLGLWRYNGFTDSCCRPLAKLPLIGHALSHTRRNGSNFRQTMELLL